MSAEQKGIVDKIDNDSKRNALRSIAILPLIMLRAYLGMLWYFRSKGGYIPVVLDTR